jgi:hypothetical protein
MHSAFYSVQQQLPAWELGFSFVGSPLVILQRQTVKCDKAAISQVLVEWSDADLGMSTWEDEVTKQP